MNNKLIVQTIFFLSLISIHASAGHKSDISCDARWAICLQSVSYDIAKTIHFVSTVKLKDSSININSQADLTIDDKTGNVNLDENNPIVIGQITEPVGDDSGYAMSREMKMPLGYTMNIASQEGKDVMHCNRNGAAFFERNYYHTLNKRLSILNGAQTVSFYDSNELVEPPFKTRTSIIACPK